MFGWINRFFKTRNTKKDGPTPEQIERVKKNFMREMERRRKAKLRRGTVGTRGAFGSITKTIPPGYDFTFPKVSEIRRLKREKAAQEKEQAA